MIPDILKAIKFAELTDEQRSELQKRLRESKRELDRALKAVDRGLVILAETKRAKTVKRRT
jgi:indole-3-glycerol phosphate synthase